MGRDSNDIKELRKLAPIETAEYTDNELTYLYNKWSNDFYAASWMSPEKDYILKAIEEYTKELKNIKLYTQIELDEQLKETKLELLDKIKLPSCKELYQYCSENDISEDNMYRIASWYGSEVVIPVSIYKESIKLDNH